MDGFLLLLFLFVFIPVVSVWFFWVAISATIHGFKLRKAKKRSGK